MRHSILLLIFSLFFFSGIAQQTKKVLVTDDSDLALPGVNIFTADHSFTTSTGPDGYFELPLIEGSQKITFTYIGFQELQLSVEEIAKAGFTVKMDVEAAHLSTVEVIGRRDESPDEIPYVTQRIGQRDIQLSNAQNPADALQNAGLFVQKSQMGGGSPIIRGFEANRVLLVIDGIRMNNAIYRSGHLQNAITPDNNAMNQIEVIFGPGSLVYGSDALGGVIHFRLKEPVLASPQEKINFSSGFMTRYSTANKERTASANVNIGGKKWGSFTNLSFSKFGDLKSGSNRPEGFEEFGKRYEYVDEDGKVVSNEDPDLQSSSGYSQINILQKIRFQPNDKIYFTASLMGSFSSDVPRYDALTETSGGTLKFKKWYYGPQNHLLASVKMRVLEPSAIYDNATFIAAWQRIDEDRYDQRLTSDWLSTSLVDVNVFSFTADFNKGLTNWPKHMFNYGFDLNHNNVDSEAYDENEDGTIDREVNSRYPNEGSQYSSMGLFAGYKYKNTAENFTFDAGLRYSFSRLFAQFGSTGPIEWPAVYRAGIEANNQALTWATGLNYQTTNDWKFRLLAATAFRSPNVDDFAKIRENGGFVTVPNPTLKPEKTFTVEASIGKTISFGDNQLSLNASAFTTQLKDAIVRQNFRLPDGSSSFISNSDTLFVQANVNATNARISGVSGNLLWSLGKDWKLKSSLTYTQGQRRFELSDDNGNIMIDEDVPQDHIPPLYGKSSLSYTKGKLNIEAVVHYNAAKKLEDYAVSAFLTDETGALVPDREGTSDNIDFSPVDANTGEYLGVYGWATYNLYTSWKLTKALTVNFAVENITDLHYRRFASGISAPGRNFVVALRGNF
jgi:hemoglobin/transferrin/lactoferrin receptor protein